MNPIVIIVPAAIMAGGTATFFLVPLDLPLRAILLAGDLVAALLVGFVLWRRHHG